MRVNFVSSGHCLRVIASIAANSSVSTCHRETNPGINDPHNQGEES